MFVNSTSYCNSFFSGPNFTIEGKFEASITAEGIVTSSRMHDQGKSGLCWDYSAATSIRKSLRIKIGK